MVVGGGWMVDGGGWGWVDVGFGGLSMVLFVFSWYYSSEIQFMYYCDPFFKFDLGRENR